MVSIRIDAKQFAAAQNLLRQFPEEVDKAASAAINRTVTTVRKEISKAVTKNYTIKSEVVKKTLDTKRSSVQRLRGEIRSTGSQMSLKRFRVSRNAMGTDFSKTKSAVDTTGGSRKRKRSPIKVRILKRRKLAPLRAGALFKTPKGEKLGLLRRVRKQSLPITTTAGPSVPQMFGAERTLEQLEPLAQETLNKRFIHEVEVRLGKKGLK